MGRWLNPDSIKIYARMTTQEYGAWVDKMMSVRRIDTARTTSLPIMDLADTLAEWSPQLQEKWEDTPATPLKPFSAKRKAVEPLASAIPAAPLKQGERLSVFWTEMDAWYNGVFKSSRVEDADGGGKQRASCVVYDAVGPWAKCTRQQLTY